MKWKIFYCLLLFSINPSIAAANHGVNEEISFIHQEISSLKDENRDQNIQIELLKEMVMKSHQQEGRLFPENQFANVIDPKTKVFRHSQKRPARLLPLQLLYNRKNDSDDAHEVPNRFYGPPANCSDLIQLGYTLNGFYLVKPDRSSMLDDANIKTVYCSFKQAKLLFDSSKMEIKVSSRLKKANQPKAIGGVHFQALTNFIPYRNVMNSHYKNIIFHDTFLNMGEGFNNDTGFFTVPKSGVYRFSFQMTLSTFQKFEKLVFELRHRTLKDISSGEIGTAVRHIFMDSKEKMFYGLIDTTLKLNRGEIIYPHIPNRGQKIIDYIYLANPIWFSGSLLEEIADDYNK